jgi:formate-dependent nitrite reductase membrane component NrfD
MPEILSTRHNHLVDPGLHVWGWEIPVYLFLGGLVAGLMVLSGYRLYRGAPRRDSAFALMPLLGLVLLGLGMLALFLDLEHKPFAWRLYVAFRPRSPMSWGAWILLLVVPVLAAMALIHPPAPIARRVPLVERAADWLARRPRIRRAIAGASVGLGIALGAYTGILLSSLGARPLWNSAALAPLFLVSGLSSSAALGHWLARDRDESEALVRADVAFLLAELALIALFLIGLASAGRAHAQAAGALLGGPFTAVFWALVVGLGVALPLLIQVLVVARRVAPTPVAPALVLGGGLALRFVIVLAGQSSHWPST